MAKKSEEQITEFYSVYQAKKGWRVWDTLNQVEGEPQVKADYASKEIAIIVAQSLQHLCK